MARLKTLRHGGVAVAASLSNLALSLARIKLLAAALGPAGYGQVALVASFVELVGVLFGAGFAGVLNRDLSRTPDRQAADRLVSGAFILPVMASLIVSPLLIVAFLALSPSLPTSLETVLLILASVQGAALWRIAGGFFQGLQRSGRMFWSQMLGTLINLAFAAALVLGGSRNFVLYAAASPALLCLTALVIDRRSLARRISIRTLPALAEIKAQLGVAVPILLTACIVTATMYYLRQTAEIRLGSWQMGMLQPGLQLNILIGSVALSFLGMTYVRWDQRPLAPLAPRFRLLLAAALGAPVLAGLVLFLGDGLLELLVRLLFSDEFLPALPTLSWLLTAEVMRISGFALNQTMISRGFNVFTLWPRLACTVVIVGAIESGWLSSSIVQISQAYFAGNLIALILVTGLWLEVQRRPAR